MTLSRCSLTGTLLLSFLLFSCSKKEIAGAQGPQGPQGPAGTGTVLKGNIQGKVLLYDIAGKAIADNSGATISLENTTPLLQASSLADGSFVIPAVPAGEYNIKVEKQGYGAMRYLNFSHSGGDQPTQTGFLEIGQQMSSQYDIARLTIDTVTAHNFPYYWVITCTLAHPQKMPNPTTVLLYLSDAPGVSKSNNLYVLWASFYPSNDSTLVYSPFDNLVSYYSDRFRTAQYVYMVAAIDNVNRFSYKDEQGISVYPDAGNTSPEAKVYNTLK